MSNTELVIYKHKNRVQELILGAVTKLIERAIAHDNSKFMHEEKSYLEELQKITDREGHATYGSARYDEIKETVLKPMLENHYKMNRHHPEHFPNGVSGMSLVDIMEMFLDWKAASERSGQTLDLTTLFAKYKIEPMLQEVLKNTAEGFGFEWK